MIEKIKNIELVINEKLRRNNVSVEIVTDQNNSGKIIITKDHQVDKIFYFKIISSCQIQIIENKKIKEYGLFIDVLACWIYNQYNKVKYIYKFYGGKFNRKILEREEVEKIKDGITKDYTELRKQGISVYREELDNQPTIKGYIGPMFDGIDYGIVNLRYETQEIYDMLSD